MSDWKEFILWMLGAVVVITTALAYLDQWLSKDLDDDIDSEIRR